MFATIFECEPPVFTFHDVDSFLFLSQIVANCSQHAEKVVNIFIRFFLIAQEARMRKRCERVMRRAASSQCLYMCVYLYIIPSWFPISFYTHVLIHLNRKHCCFGSRPLFSRSAHFFSINYNQPDKSITEKHRCRFQ